MEGWLQGSFLLHWAFPCPDDKKNCFFQVLRQGGSDVGARSRCFSRTVHCLFHGSVSHILTRSLWKCCCQAALFPEAALDLVILYSFVHYIFIFTHSLTALSFCRVIHYALKSLCFRCQFWNHPGYWERGEEAGRALFSALFLGTEINVCCFQQDLIALGRAIAQALHYPAALHKCQCNRNAVVFQTTLWVLQTNAFKSCPTLSFFFSLSKWQSCKSLHHLL